MEKLYGSKRAKTKSSSLLLYYINFSETKLADPPVANTAYTTLTRTFFETNTHYSTITAASVIVNTFIILCLIELWKVRAI